ncbi:glycosyltransferase family 2 protein [Streptomyces sp. NRRL F-5123]|uniref:glycosyltransferase family 2 protein n=1 Tax=Streptomyces sp. NRRL F-5123 TaxID=1463856 RepID=UPI0004E16D73|nr:glycosyltransferase family 2 protein [Streptomyces sp. NRRL F-5123]
MTTPDVTVVVAVYNTMPYLTDCLTSLVEQSIGLDRLEVVAVDDGSTDDSLKELERFASLHPGTVKVLRQPNSGGPAAPSNKALDAATGRYVFFIGSDDRLAPYALERMVAAADEHGSDVVVGKMEGTNGRYVHQELYQETRHDVTFTNSALPWTVANTKLFRRELVERHGLRFPEDMPVGSDQPFTIEACLRASRISVLADGTYYYAVKREDAGNITYRANHEARLACAARVMDHVAGLVEPGPLRDAVLMRHFRWELAKLLQDDFPALDAAVRERLVKGIADLADRYLTDAVRDSMGVKQRVRIGLAQAGRTAELCALIEDEAEHGAPPFVLEGEHAYARYPGFRDADAVLPMRWFEVVEESVAGRLAAGARATSAVWGRASGQGPVLDVTARIGLLGSYGAGPAFGASLVMEGPADTADVAVDTRVKGTPKGGAATLVAGRVPLRSLVAAAPRTAVRWRPVLAVTLAGKPYRVRLRAAGVQRQRVLLRGMRAYAVSLTSDDKGRLVCKVAPIGLRAVAARLLRLRKK